MKRPDVGAWIITGLCAVGIVVLALLHQPIPDVLVNLSTAALGAAAGVSFAGGSGVADALAALLAHLQGRPTPTTPSPVPAALVAPRPAPVPLTAEPPTGVFRPATHA